MDLWSIPGYQQMATKRMKRIYYCLSAYYADETDWSPRLFLVLLKAAFESFYVRSGKPYEGDAHCRK